MTKLFTAVAVLQLVERGTIGLDTSAVDFLELADTAISPAVNVHHLLTEAADHLPHLARSHRTSHPDRAADTATADTSCSD